MRDQIHQARDFALLCHGDQKYGKYPYVVHLDAVVAVLREFGVVDADVLSAGYLHDSVEDTPATVVDITDLFGMEVARLVSAVTNAPGKNRLERSHATYPKIRAAGTKAVMVKLADRLANARAGLSSNRHLLEMYRREHPYFRSVLLSTDDGPTIAALWAALDSILG